MATTATAAEIDWGSPITERIAGFLNQIGVPVVATPLPADTFLPALDIRDGVLLVDPSRLDWPGDLLHEAGHIAVTDPALRPALGPPSDDGGEEMAAIAWSYAAALAAGVEPEVVFHAGGYRGGGEWIAENFRQRRYFGVPMLVWYGMTEAPESGSEEAFPHMRRWLR